MTKKSNLQNPITIFTHAHERLLQNSLTNDILNTELLSENLIDFLFTQNPITNLSKDLRNYIYSKIGETLKQNLSEELNNYINENNYIDIDGFINFRLPPYAHEIDKILYAIVKKSLYKLY